MFNLVFPCVFSSSFAIFICFKPGASTADKVSAGGHETLEDLVLDALDESLRINEGMNEGRREYEYEYDDEYEYEYEYEYDDDDDDDDDDHNHFLCSSHCQHWPGGVEAV